MNSINWKYVIPLTNKDGIKEVEKKYNILLSDDLKECIKTNNAGYPNKKIFDTELSKERIFKDLISYNKEDEENIYQFEKLFYIGLIPFGLDPSGNILCMDNNNNKVVLYLHETGEKELVSNNFSEFLNKLY